MACSLPVRPAVAVGALEVALVAWTHVGLWRMLTDWLHDPQRRWQVFWKTVEVGIAILVALAIFQAGMRRRPGRPAAVAIVVAAVVAGILASWLAYEFIFEPLRLSGPYWERTPAPGTTYRWW